VTFVTKIIFICPYLDYAPGSGLRENCAGQNKPSRPP
jgi:hypothetical protein